MRSARRRLLAALVVLASACEPVEPMDHPFQQVPVKTARTATPPTAGGEAGAATEDPRFADFDQGFTISSEELLGGRAAGPDDAGSPGGPADDDASPTGDTTADAAASAADGAASSAGGAGTQGAGAAAGPAPSATASMAATAPVIAPVPAAPLGWAIRLVSTLPQAQPPRAILGLPDGREIVVTPGSMVPDAGLVVLSIGPQGVQLAHVQAVGDHATVAPISLTPQY
ncbi:MAG: hypothetical protein D6798_09105 [Deltaproteobacteria bacterium]|nr:MAG: hypothetical protein D6798_09105 [Deltaproteobacteria bacterium]